MNSATDIILWDVDPYDWKRPGPAVVRARILKETRPGSIVLSHDIHPGTIEAMPSTFDELEAKGFKFVTVSELIKHGSGSILTSESAAERNVLPNRRSIPFPDSVASSSPSVRPAVLESTSSRRRHRDLPFVARSYDAQ